MYAYEAPQLGGLGSKFKKIVKKVEKVTRPLAKVAAVGTAAMFAPALLPAAAALASKPKAEPMPAELALPAPGQPAVTAAPAAVAAAAPPTLPQMLPQLFAPAAQPLQPMFMQQQKPEQPPADKTKTMLIYGGLGLGALGLLALAMRRR